VEGACLHKMRQGVRETEEGVMRQPKRKRLVHCAKCGRRILSTKLAAHMRKYHGGSG
jgi:hypothetical protein